MTFNPEVDCKRFVCDLVNLPGLTDRSESVIHPELVHRIRVAIKQIRAWLKFYRDIYGNTNEYQELVTNLRTLSHRLNAIRDQYILVETATKLVEKYPGKKASYLLAELQQNLAEQKIQGMEEQVWAEDFIAKIKQGLALFEQLEMTQTSRQETITKTYIKMCASGRHALSTEQCDDLHAWRKLVKTLGYQQAVAGPGQLPYKKQFNRIIRLGSKLGDVHDLCILEDRITAINNIVVSNIDWSPLFHRVEKERDSLMRAIRKLYRHICPGQK